MADRKRRKKKYFGYFATLNPNAGNVLYNNAMFNSMMNDHGEGSDVDNGASEGVAMAEDYNDYREVISYDLSDRDLIMNLCKKHHCKTGAQGVGRVEIIGNRDDVKRVADKYGYYRFTGELEESFNNKEAKLQSLRNELPFDDKIIDMLISTAIHNGTITYEKLKKFGDVFTPRDMRKLYHYLFVINNLMETEDATADTAVEIINEYSAVADYINSVLKKGDINKPSITEDYDSFNDNVILKISSQDMEQGVLNDEDITPYTLGMYYNLYFTTDRDSYYIEGTAENIDQFIKDFHIKDLKSVRFVSEKELKKY